MFPLKYDITLPKITDDSSEKLHKNQFIPSQNNRWTATSDVFSSRENFTRISTQLDVHLGKMMLFYAKNNKCYTIKTKSSLHNFEDNNVCFLLVLVPLLSPYLYDI
jgi:hypothetical protein